MTNWEKTVGDILVALVKSAGTGELTLTPEQMTKEPNEVVYIYNNGDGSFTLKIKDVTTIEGV